MPKKIQPSIKSLLYVLPDTTSQSYIDIARDLSRVNRRLYEQSKSYVIHSMEWVFASPTGTFDQTYVAVGTAGDSWAVHNAHTKGKALWNQMNKLVLSDNPSIKGKWADFKVYLDSAHKAGSTLNPVDWNRDNYEIGEWNYSTFVMPQHNVDPVSGEPLPALEVEAHLVGDDTHDPLQPGSTVGLVKAYGQSRATVQPTDPNVPASMSESFFNLLTDSGSQEPELADVIEAENDQPPYDDSHYPGGADNAPFPVVQDFAMASETHPNGFIGSFVAECGLMRLSIASYKDGVIQSDFPEGTLLRINLMPGTYKGVAALPMGQ